MYNVDFAATSTAAHLSDADVIAKILSGDKNLYAILVRRYNARLYRVAMSIINDDTEVEEMMQAAYIKAYENLGKFSFRAEFSTWLTRILINECFQFLRVRKNAVQLNRDIMENALYQQAIDGSTPATKVLNAELRSILEQAIMKLPEKYRIVFVMREIEKMNVAQTKACLDISGINVKVRLNRAKALLRKSLKDIYPNEEVFKFHLSRCDRMVSQVLLRI